MDDLPALSRRKKPRSERELSTTTYAILGMLVFDEMSGYDVGKLIERSIAHFGFKPAKSQVYTTLRRLVTLGWASEREVAQHDRPDKRLYRITSDGERALRAWLESPGVEPEVVRSPFLLKVFFGGMVPRETLLAQVKEAHRLAVEELEVLEDVERYIEELNRTDLRFPSLVLRYGLAHNRASVAWTLGVLQELEAQTQASHRDDPSEADRVSPQEGSPLRPKRPRASR